MRNTPETCAGPQEKRLRALVLEPLRVLRDLLRGPRNLIRKRLDKLLDYEQIQEKTTLSYEEQVVASTYRSSPSPTLRL